MHSSSGGKLLWAELILRRSSIFRRYVPADYTPYEPDAYTGRQAVTGLEKRIGMD